MEYIRTKDGIFEVKATPQSNAIYKGSHTYCIYDHIEMVDRDITEKDIIAQADTIEELCDEFVDIYKYEKPDIALLRDIKFFESYKNHTVYGAIWTNKGLIYVAKMNDKGELELL